MKYKLLFWLLIILSLASSGFSQDTKLNLQFDVLDENGNFFADLKPADLQIEGFRNFALDLQQDMPLEIIVMLDASLSQEKVLPLEKQAALVLIDDFLKAGKDQIAVVGFTGVVDLKQDLTGDFQKAREQIGKIEFAPPAGLIGSGVPVSRTPPNSDQALTAATSVRGALKHVLEVFSKIPARGNSQRAIILITNGIDTYGETKTREVIGLAAESNIPVFAVGLGDRAFDGVDKRSLRRITEETGGILMLPKKNLEDLPAFFKITEAALRSGYRLSFADDSAIAKNKPPELKIKIVNPQLRARKLKIVQARAFDALN